ncbi:MAG: DUF3267 domain-containing protein [Clostridia bacterium]|nr:DUF3267 domain-containing protein [Clostridia bacterium]
MKHYEKELPMGYRAAYTVDAASRKVGVWLNVIAAIVMAAIIAAAFLIIRPGSIFKNGSPFAFLALAAGLLAYIVLHELVHGAAYKLLTGRRLTFGLTATVAYCGVPDIYVYRRASLIALLAPFVVFTLLFGGLVMTLANPVNRFFAAIALAVHVGGCAGDLYDTGLYLLRFRDPRTLMRDTGPKQTFYLPE